MKEIGHRSGLPAAIGCTLALGVARAFLPLKLVTTPLYAFTGRNTRCNAGRKGDEFHAEKPTARRATYAGAS